MTPRVVGLDLSLSRTGIAHVDGSTSVAQARPAKLRGGERLDMLAGQIVRAIPVGDVDLVVIEDYSPGSVGINGKLANAELHGVVLRACWMAGAAVVKIRPNMLKRYATGSGTADKDAMIVAADVAGWAGGCHDEADAWWLRHMGVAAITGEATAERLAVVDAVAWPVVAP